MGQIKWIGISHPKMMNLSDSQLQWACDHLGHTKAVHLNHYRQLSGHLECVQIAKLKIVHDMKLTGELKGKSMVDKELNEAVLKKIQEEIAASDAEIGNPEPVLAYVINFNYDQSTSLETIEIFENEGLEKQSQKPKVGQRWMDEEIKEIRKFFADF
uniref:Uncharacterized protein LOC111116108 n=1 Tax=Crassostrea virginica TaxID=6565 RepID=A0A8B8C5E5_CRAVI|nr:uncharacterized protein LOC111116108 [Crassostrea virginica]